MTRFYYLAKLLLSRLLIKVERTALYNYTRVGTGEFFLSVIVFALNTANDNHTTCITI